MRVSRKKPIERISKALQKHIKYLRSLRRAVAKKSPRGRVRDSVEKALTRSLKLQEQVKALASQRGKLETREARIAKRIRQMKSKSWGKIKKKPRKK